MNKVLTIQDFSCYGQCSLTVALPILSAMGLETICLPTALLSTHTAGFSGYTCLDLTSEIKKITKHWEKENIHFDAISTGYLGGVKQVEVVKQIVDDNPNVFCLIDPAMADGGKLYPAFDMEYVKAMKSLCLKAKLVTPNVTECYLLAGLEVKKNPSLEELQEVMKKLKADGIRHLLVTGVDLGEDNIGSCYYDDEEKFHIISSKKIPAKFHGTGDIYAAVLFGSLVKGLSLDEAIIKASKFTAEAVKRTVNDLDTHPYGVHFEEGLKNLK